MSVGASVAARVVLHLFDGWGPHACPTSLALLRDAFGRLPDYETHALLLGGQPLRACARAVQLLPVGADRSEDGRVACCGVPGGTAMTGLARLRRALAEAEERLGKPDLIHTWSVASLTAATILRPQTPRLMTLTSLPPKWGVRWLRAVASYQAERGGAATTLLPISATIRRWLLSQGLAQETVHTLRPSLDLGRVARSARVKLRRSWGITQQQDAATAVVALLSDPPQAADAKRAMAMLGSLGATLSELGIASLRMLIHPHQRSRAVVDWNLRRMPPTYRQIQDPSIAQPWASLPGVDAAVVIGPKAGGLSLLWAMGANVPIVGQATHAISEIVEDRHSALLAPPHDGPALAHRLQRLLGDRQLAWSLRDTARHEAFSFFSRQRYCRDLTEVYRQAIDGEPVSVPEMEITGGMRFAGRG